MLRMTHLISAILEPPFPITHPMISLGTVISWVWCVLPPRPPPPANAARAEMDIFQIFYLFIILYFFRYYSASGAWLAHLQGREPRGQIRLIRSIRWCWWDRRQPAREGAARPSPSVQRTLSSRHQGKSLDTDDSGRLKSKWKHFKTKWVKRELFPFFSDTHVFETNLQCCNIFHCHL